MDNRLSLIRNRRLQIADLAFLFWFPIDMRSVEISSDVDIVYYDGNRDYLSNDMSYIG
jgi:hypothetical protein